MIKNNPKESLRHSGSVSFYVNTKFILWKKRNSQLHFLILSLPKALYSLQWRKNYKTDQVALEREGKKHPLF